MPIRDRFSLHFAFAMLGCMGLGCLGCQKAEVKAPAPKPQEVLFVAPVQQTVTESEEFTGRTWAMNTVEIRARVSGYLDEVKFKDGDLVKEGDLLFRIDPRSFKAEEARAKATVAQNRARLDRLGKQYKRGAQLVQSNSMTQEEFEQIVSDRNEAEATLAGANADQDIAALNLSYTEVKSPISGRISRRLVDPGNLVTADTTLLATIVTVDPIYVYFDIDERTVLRLKRLVREGDIKSVRDSQVEVQIALADETEFKHTGIVNFIDNQVDPTTGTLRFRAIMDNAKNFYSPGLFVRLRLPIGEPHPALLVPEEALGTDQGQRFVYVVNDKDEIEYRRVKTGLLANGMRVIESGVESADRVVVTGLQRIRKGAKVVPKLSTSDAAPVAAN